MQTGKTSALVSVLLGAALVATLPSTMARTEILAMVNYETKADADPAPARREGLMVLDVDPASPRFGQVLMDMPLPPDTMAHHLFYNRAMSKLYLTSFGGARLQVMDMTRFPYRLEAIDVSACKVAEDLIFSADDATWYLTCMGSDKIIVGNAATDRVTAVIDTPKPYPHGIAAHQGIDRLLVTSTIRDSDLGDPGETITVIETSTGTPLGSIKLSNKPSPSGEAPVEILFVPGSNPPVAYITNIYGGTLWTATWNPATQDFEVAQVLDVGTLNEGIPLEIYVNAAADRLYVTTAMPGRMHVFDIGADAAKPTRVKTFDAAAGAHHVAFTKDERYAFVQNTLLNLKGMRDGSITVVDLKAGKVTASIDTLKTMGLNPNSIVLLPEWNSLAGH